MNFSYDQYEKIAAVFLSFCFLTAGFIYKVTAPFHETELRSHAFDLTGTEFLNTGLSMGFGTGVGASIARKLSSKKDDETQL